MTQVIAMAQAYSPLVLTKFYFKNSSIGNKITQEISISQTCCATFSYSTD